MKRVTIADVAYYLPVKKVSNDDLLLENPTWAKTLGKTGVVSRHIAEEEETALDLSLKACENLFSRNNGWSEKVDAIIYCTESPDYIIPPNSCILQSKLKLPSTTIAFDFTLACSGYVYGLMIAKSLVQSGSAQCVLLVTADTYSKYINKHDRGAKLLFGDAASASIITESSNKSEIIDIICETDGNLYDQFMIPAGGCRIPHTEATQKDAVDSHGNKRNLANIHMNGLGVLQFVKSRPPKQVRTLLSKNNLAMDDIDLVIFHQASGIALDSLEKILRIDSQKNFRNISSIGNTVSSSIPIAYAQAKELKRLRSNQKVMFSSFGAGLSWASAIIQL